MNVPLPPAATNNGGPPDAPNLPAKAAAAKPRPAKPPAAKARPAKARAAKARAVKALAAKDLEEDLSDSFREEIVCAKCTM
jgi:hypothetical protein